MATTFQGFVRSNGLPAIRALRCYDQTSGTFVATTTSASDGSYSFTGLGASTSYCILAIDPASNSVKVYGPMLPTTEALDFNFSGANDSSSPLPVKLGYVGSISQTGNLALALSFSTTQSASAHPPVYPSQTAVFNGTFTLGRITAAYGAASAVVRKINYTVTQAVSLTYPPPQPSHFRGPTYTVKGYGAASAVLRAPLYSVSGTIVINPYGVIDAAFIIPKKLKAFGATSAQLTMPKYTVTGFINSPQTIKGKARWLKTKVTGTLQSAEQGRAAIKYLLPRTVKGYGAASATLTAPRYTVTGSILVDDKASGYFRAPLFTVSGRVVNRDTGKAHIRAIRFSTVYAHAAKLRAPIFALQAENFSYSAHSLAYVMTMETGAITRYLNYGFDNVVNFNNHYYGIKADGIYELTGNTDAGTAIAASAEFPPNDFGDPHLKRLNYVYIDSSDTTLASPKYDGTPCGPYTSNFIGRRTQVGKGGKGRYWGLVVQNQDGGNMDIKSIELDFLETRRV